MKEPLVVVNRHGREPFETQLLRWMVAHLEERHMDNTEEYKEWCEAARDQIRAAERRIEAPDPRE